MVPYMVHESSSLKFLELAVRLSREAFDVGGFPAASVLVRDGKEIARGLSSTGPSHDVTAHGEIQAIRAARDEAHAPLTLFTSLEPCLMCLAASAWAGVDEIYFGCRKSEVDPTFYVNTVDAASAATILVRPPKLHFIGDFEQEVVSLTRAFSERLATAMGR